MKMKRELKVSLIISTYNWPEALELSLLGVAEQSVMPVEVIIADDGSKKETADLIDRMREKVPCPLVHVWHEDTGFRLAAIRNKAIARSTGDYIIQIDGDIIPEKHFIEDHIKLAEKSFFIAGSRANLTSQLTDELFKTKRINLTPFTKGVRNTFNALRIPVLTSYFIFRYRRKHAYYARGCNLSFWKDDLIKVNGYNEDLEGWGKEDSELLVRLINIGVARKFIKFAGIVYHLYHTYSSREGLKKNVEIYEKAIKEKCTYCSNGLSNYL